MGYSAIEEGKETASYSSHWKCLFGRIGGQKIVSGCHDDVGKTWRRKVTNEDDMHHRSPYHGKETDFIELAEAYPPLKPL